MAAALPAAKLAGLLVKTLSKPMAKRLKREAIKHPNLNVSLGYLGQTAHQIVTRMTISANGYKVKTIAPMEHSDAVAKGAEVFGESIVFSVASGVVIWEYARSNSSAREKAEKANLLSIETDAKHSAQLELLDERIEALEKVVQANESQLNIFKVKYVDPLKSVGVGVGGDETETDKTKKYRKLRIEQAKTWHKKILASKKNFESVQFPWGEG